MKILVAGAGITGTHVIEQLKKNSTIEILVLDPRENPDALKKGVISKIDIKETLTPLTFDFIVKNHQPDMVLLAFESEDMGLGNIQGMDMLTAALRTELSAISPIPVIPVSNKF